MEYCKRKLNFSWKELSSLNSRWAKFFSGLIKESNFIKFLRLSISGDENSRLDEITALFVNSFHISTPDNFEELNFEEKTSIIYDQLVKENRASTDATKKRFQEISQDIAYLTTPEGREDLKKIYETLLKKKFLRSDDILMSALLYVIYTGSFLDNFIQLDSPTVVKLSNLILELQFVAGEDLYETIPAISQKDALYAIKEALPPSQYGFFKYLFDQILIIYQNPAMKGKEITLNLPKSEIYESALTSIKDMVPSRWPELI